MKPYIWSSSLLYNEEIKNKREQWFSSFLENRQDIDGSTMLDFHVTAGEGNSESDLLMDRGFVKTKSISQFSQKDDMGTFQYIDLKTQETTTTIF